MQLAEEHWRLIRRIAGAVHAKLPPMVEIGDLIGDGFIGLRSALKRFDPAQEVRFEDYAAIRIRGAILDGVRKRDWLKRHFRKNSVKPPRFQHLKIEQVYEDPNPERIDQSQWKEARSRVCLVERA